MYFLNRLLAALLFVVSLSILPVSASAQTHKTYLVNGIASAVPFIGYGMRNLKKKIRGAKLFSYLTSAEGNVIRNSIIKDASAAYAANPNVKINLVGISYGANMISQIASSLGSKGIPVNYLGIIDGTNLAAIKSNVAKADNFVCTNADCTGARMRLAGGNSVTATKVFTIKSSHIPLGDNATVHGRVVRQIR